MCWPLCIPSAAAKYSVLSLYLYGSLKTTLAKGAPLPGYDACTHACSWEDWGAWLTAMDGAKVQLSVTNVGNGTANIKATMIGNNGVTYTQTYNGINNIDANDLAFKLTMEKAHLVFDLPFANSSFASARKHYSRAHRR